MGIYLCAHPERRKKEERRNRRKREERRRGKVQETGPFQLCDNRFECSFDAKLGCARLSPAECLQPSGTVRRRGKEKETGEKKKEEEEDTYKKQEKKRRNTKMKRKGNR